jgi:hypothetical protein
VLSNNQHVNLFAKLNAIREGKAFNQPDTRETALCIFIIKTTYNICEQNAKKKFR